MLCLVPEREEIQVSLSFFHKSPPDVPRVETERREDPSTLGNDALCPGAGEFESLVLTRLGSRGDPGGALTEAPPRELCPVIGQKVPTDRTGDQRGARVHGCQRGCEWVCPRTPHTCHVLDVFRQYLPDTCCTPGIVLDP